jgi:hypothetical protein
MDARAAHGQAAMSLRRISVSAIKQLHTEQERFEEQAMMEIQEPHTRSRGIVRLDLIEQCRRRLLFLRYMLKDAEGRADQGYGRNASD